MKITKSQLKKIIKEEIGRLATEATPQSPPGQGANRFAYFKDDLLRRLSVLQEQEKQEVLDLIQKLLELDDEAEKWQKGERERYIKNMTYVLGRESDPNQEQVSKRELLELYIFPDDILLRIDNKAARALMKSIRLLLELGPEEQEYVARDILGIDLEMPRIKTRSQRAAAKSSTEKELVINMLIHFFQNQGLNWSRQELQRQDLDSLKSMLQKALEHKTLDSRGG